MSDYWQWILIIPMIPNNSDQFRLILIKPMKNNTIEEYIRAVKAKYEEAKTGEYASFLLNPSPAELKILCLLLFDNGMSKQDQEIVDHFFDLNENANKRKQIEWFHVVKLKPISNFLKGKTETTRVANLDLIAFLVDFNSRPFRKFRTGEEIVKLTADYSINESSRKDKHREPVIENSESVFEDFKKRIISKRIALVVLSLFVFGSVSYGIKNNFFPKRNCMVWAKDHYNAVDYDTVKDTAEVIVLNQYLLDNFKKITVSDATLFFKNGDCNHPLVWYGKSPNKSEYEYFTRPGLHPVTGKTLKPISRYIIKKYILSK